jgi:hypothetical protein
VEVSSSATFFHVCKENRSKLITQRLITCPGMPVSVTIFTNQASNCRV